MSTHQITINSEVYQLIPYGQCACGCGRPTNFSDRTRNGIRKGQLLKYIHGHNEVKKGVNHPNWKGGRNINGAGYVQIYMPNHPRNNKGFVLEHILIVEEALGKELPPNAVIHHVDGDKQNNQCSNLVLCQNTAYHQIIHQRERAFRECGHANWKKCYHCGLYDDPSKMYVYPNQPHSAYHRECKSKFQKDKYKNNK